MKLGCDLLKNCMVSVYATYTYKENRSLIEAVKRRRQIPWKHTSICKRTSNFWIKCKKRMKYSIFTLSWYHDGKVAYDDITPSLTHSTLQPNVCTPNTPRLIFLLICLYFLNLFLNLNLSWCNRWAMEEVKGLRSQCKLVSSNKYQRIIIIGKNKENNQYNSVSITSFLHSIVFSPNVVLMNTMFVVRDSGTTSFLMNWIKPYLNSSDTHTCTHTHSHKNRLGLSVLIFYLFLNLLIVVSCLLVCYLWLLSFSCFDKGPF